MNKEIEIYYIYQDEIHAGFIVRTYDQWFRKIYRVSKGVRVVEITRDDILGVKK